MAARRRPRWGNSRRRNQVRRGNWLGERLEARVLMAGDVFISEFLAQNDGGLADQDGDASDWIEIYNAGAADVNLQGWHLTDDADELTKWDFPSVVVPAGGFLVVFASSKD